MLILEGTKMILFSHCNDLFMQILCNIKSDEYVFFVHRNLICNDSFYVVLINMKKNHFYLTSNKNF